MEKVHKVHERLHQEAHQMPTVVYTTTRDQANTIEMIDGDLDHAIEIERDTTEDVTEVGPKTGVTETETEDIGTQGIAMTGEIETVEMGRGVEVGRGMGRKEVWRRFPRRGQSLLTSKQMRQ